MGRFRYITEQRHALDYRGSLCRRQSRRCCNREDPFATVHLRGWKTRVRWCMQRGRASDQRADTKKPNRTEAIRRYRTTLPVRRHIRCLGQYLNDDREWQLFRPIIGRRSFDTPFLSNRLVCPSFSLSLSISLNLTILKLYVPTIADIVDNWS